MLSELLDVASSPVPRGEVLIFLKENKWRQKICQYLGKVHHNLKKIMIDNAMDTERVPGEKGDSMVF